MAAHILKIYILIIFSYFAKKWMLKIFYLLIKSEFSMIKIQDFM